MSEIKTQRTEQSIMLDILFVLAVLTFMAFFFYGGRVLIVVSISIISSLITDILCVKIMRKKYEKQDFSAIATGTIIALMMPATISYGILILTNIIAITIGKQIFGGKGKNIFNPAAVGFIFSSICWKETVLMYPRPSDILDLSSNVSNTLYASLTETLSIATTPPVSDIDIMLGRFTGPMGGTHIIILLVCAIVLIFRKSISGIIFGSAFSTIMLFAYIYPKFGATRSESLYYELFSGLTIFGLIFLACDYYTAPKRTSSKLMLGLAIGGLTVIFRHVGNVQNAILYAIIIANPLSISFDNRNTSIRKSIGRLFLKVQKLLIEEKNRDKAIKKISIRTKTTSQDSQQKKTHKLNFFQRLIYKIRRFFRKLIKKIKTKNNKTDSHNSTKTVKPNDKITKNPKNRSDQ